VTASKVERAEALAAELAADADSRRRRAERRRAARLDRLLADRRGRDLILALTDEVLRIDSPSRAAGVLAGLTRAGPRLVDDWRAAPFLAPLDRAALVAGGRLAPRLAGLVVPLARQRVLREMSGAVLPAGERRLAAHARRRSAAGIRLNVNLLGEAVVGEDEARSRAARVGALLRRPSVDYVSVKISSVASQLDVLAAEAEEERLCQRLRPLLAQSLASGKFVNLDMEEYRDLELTLAVFCRLLGEDGLAPLNAGIVLQAYLPDSLPALEELVRFARRRRDRGGGWVKVRLVKGANLAAETVEAELHGWPRAPFERKVDADTHYKRMLAVALDPLCDGALRVGVGSHNLFEVAWARVSAEEAGATGRVEFEMLEGMAPALAEAVASRWGLLLYTPVVERGDRQAAIAYLVRRLDENSAPDNFLAHQFGLTVGSPVWQAELERFRASVDALSGPPPAPTRRTQDRAKEADDPSPPAAAIPAPAGAPGAFANEPDTDFTRPANRRWVAAHLERAGAGLGAYGPVVDGQMQAGGDAQDGIDPSRGAVAYRWTAASAETVAAAIEAAGRGQREWAGRPPADRRQVLEACASALARARGRLVGVMAVDAGKTVREADGEVSEAVDFARYYARNVPDGSGFSPYGTVTVASPWNFPLSIPAGGVLAALAAGNSVILKPAPETVAVAGELVRVLWAAGVPPAALGFVPALDGDDSARLVADPGVDAVVLTGSWDTAQMFLSWRPDLNLHAETSGKNAMVVTATADPDQAIADLIHSAFSHAGQKCSAASLAIIEAPVFDDRQFLRRLADAVRSLRVGSADDPASTVGPLIRAPEGPLRQALTRLEPGERWLVEPRRLDRAGYRWHPGVKLGVEPGSHFHLTECFGPVLGVMRAADLDQALAWQNATPYGLTAGLQALDPAEIDWWRARVEAGNLYVNRGMTGALVARQPFGGWKRSAVGPGAKAGGPNYVASLGRPAPGIPAAAELRSAWAELARPTDAAGLRAESNVLRYRPLRRVGVMGTTGVDAARAAAGAVGAQLVPVAGLDQAAGCDRLRLLDPVDLQVLAAARAAGVEPDPRPVAADARTEMLRWVREQAVSESRHRHGNVTGRRPGLLPLPAG
jgi:RHH-type proline utilization regulon transcriptional repressor/proline dehydrogenase/delta 1-pyrroline-5-carboxylate dehydrogenase